MSVYPGQKIITTQGTVRVVAFISIYGTIYAYSSNGDYEIVIPRYDAWGGEHDLNLGLAA